MDRLHELADCCICPRNCHADRFSDKLGYCKSSTSFNVASICNHKGEEPVISGKQGICNVFFSRCNMQCVYCQNYQISNHSQNVMIQEWKLDEITARIIAVLAESGNNMLGFVSPSHQILQMRTIIDRLQEKGCNPTIVYNSNGYDKREVIEQLSDIVDIYLPDFKYIDHDISLKYSDCADYFEYARYAIKEMYRQKGSLLEINDQEYAVKGMIIRHLVIPGQVQNSLDIIRFIAEEISANIHLSIMSQYYPPYPLDQYPEINRTLYEKEYQQVIEQMEKYGLHKGWTQEIESSSYYNPEFNNEHPFELIKIIK
jgi:putative pyruvate formate lyase activating enzyme